MFKGKFFPLATASLIIAFSMQACSILSGKNTKKLQEGLLVHLDASDYASLEFQSGKVMRWRDISGNGNDATTQEKEAPLYQDKVFNGLGMISFDGAQQLKTRPLDLRNGISVFIVFKRESSQKSGRLWQTGLYWGDGKVPDNTSVYHLTMGRTAEELSMRIFCNSSAGKFNNPLIIGANANKNGCLSGDIGEILVFDKAQLSPDEIENIRNYLLEKWHFVEDEWVRLGPLSKLPDTAEGNSTMLATVVMSSGSRTADPPVDPAAWITAFSMRLKRSFGSRTT